MSVLARLADPGWTPGRADFPALFEMIESERGDEVVKVLSRAGLPAAVAALEPVTPHRIALVGRVARTAKDERLVKALIDALGHDDAKVRKAAIVALGKVKAPGVEEALVARHAVASEIDKRAIVVSLGKVGGSKALELVRSIDASGDASLARNVTRASLVLERTTSRGETSEIDLDAKLAGPRQIVWRCRKGLEAIVLDQAGKAKLGKGEVSGERDGTLRSILAVRSALDACIAFPMGPIARPEIIETMQAWTKGTPRFRAEFVGGGHRRSELWKIAETTSGSAIVNDPTGATWDVLVDEANDRLLLKPKADPRFAYRVKDVPAASHPTIAAAIAHVGGVRADDVVWDPFVGSGLELVERARSGPYARLIGSDVSEDALAAARANLDSAGVRADLVQGDARDLKIRGLTLVLANPPMGRRLVRDKSLGELYDAVIENVSRLLEPGGRMVWLSAMADRTAGMARSVGLTVDRGRPVDVGGFEAELQIFRAPAASPSGPDRLRSPSGRRSSR